MNLDEFSTQRKENLSTVSQLLAQIQKVNSLNDAKELHDLETASSSGISHVPSQPMSIPSPRGLIFACSLIHGTHWYTRKRPSSALFENQRIWYRLHADLRPIGTGKITEQREGVRQ